MKNHTLQLTQNLIRFKSNPDQPEALSEVLEFVKAKIDAQCIEDFERNGTKSILAYNSRTRPSKFKVILNGHLDVIPGKDKQYLPVLIGNKLYGVGAFDMKAGVACLIEVFNKISSKVDYPLALQLVTDEETGGFNGTKHQIDEGVRADFVISAESTNLNIVNQAKGILWLKISAKGKTAHGAYPWKGINALWIINTFLNNLHKKYPTPNKQRWETTVNLSKIETNNNSFNKIPDQATAWLDIRIIPGDRNKVLSDIKAILPDGCKLEIITDEPELSVSSSSYYLKKLQEISSKIAKKEIQFYGAQGSSDARHFTKIKCDGIEFGPSGGGTGTDKEWIDISSLETYKSILKKFLLSLNNK